VKVIACKTCQQPFTSSDGRRVYCDRPDCRRTKAPVVYRFVCPDGRSYVGAASDCRNRANHGVARSNTRLLAAYEQYPPETWTYEILERLVPGCSERELREAEQRHIDSLRSYAPEAGFNVLPAIWEGDGPAQRAGRQFGATAIAAVREAWREFKRRHYGDV
jgi:hypothetical protein